MQANNTETIDVQPEAPPAPTTNETAVARVPSVGPGRITAEHLLALPDSERRNNWINSLVEAEVARQHYTYDKSLARDFAACGEFDDLKKQTADQAIATAMVKIQLGRSWGFNAADSMRYIYFTNGRPAVENEIVAAKLQQAGYDWDVEFLEETIQHNKQPWQKCVGVRLWLKKWNASEQRYKPMLDRNNQPISVAFTEGDADHAMIWEKGKQIPLSQKWNFQSWGRDMYYWRAISRVKKYHAPHVLRGAVSREEALEMIPVEELRPGQVPKGLEAPAEEQPKPEKPSVRDIVMGQESFLDEPPAEPPLPE